VSSTTAVDAIQSQTPREGDSRKAGVPDKNDDDTQDDDWLSESVYELCQENDVEQAVRMLFSYKIGTCAPPIEMVFTMVMSNLAARQQDSTSCYVEQLDALLEQMKALSAAGYPQCTPTGAAYNAVALGWSKCTTKARKQDAVARCETILSELWAQYRATNDTRFVPFKATYVSTLTALARSGGGMEAAQRAEEHLEEMELYRLENPWLAPSTICVNIVL